MAVESRAVSAEQKRERREMIINTARDFFRGSDLSEISISGIASRCGLAKGTVFFYFATKESLFLALARDEIENWYGSFNSILENRKGEFSTSGELIAAVQQSLGRHPLVLKIFALLNSSLERNIDRETVYDFKLFLKNSLEHTGGLLERKYPALKPGTGFRLLLFAYTLISGLYPMANPPEAVRDIVKLPEMKIFDVDFDQTFGYMMDIIIRGMGL